jgi:hypothetical protein
MQLIIRAHGTMEKTVKIRLVLIPLLLAACAQQSTPPAPQAAAPPPVAQASAPQRWEIARVRCDDLLAASEEDRASAAMFYYGYLSARAGLRFVEGSQIEGNIHRVIEQCEATPTITVVQAFARAIPPERRGAAGSR